MESSSSRPHIGLFSYFLLFLSLTNVTFAHPQLHQWLRRAVEWVTPTTDRAASSICNPEQQGWIQYWQTEAPHLAAAGAEGLGHAFNAFFDSQKFGELSEEDRARYFNTYASFFGFDEDDDSNAVDAAFITDLAGTLSYIASLAPEAYPEQIRIGCDTSFFNPTTPEGKTVGEVHPSWPPPAQGSSYLYDDDGRPEEFYTVPEWAICANTFPAWTGWRGGSMYNRVVFCPYFWQQSPPKGTMQDFGSSITAGTSDLSMFIWMGSKVFFHEMLHTVTISGKQADDPNKYDDVQGLNSYGPVNAMRIAQEDRAAAMRNIENIVFYCIALYYKDYDWSTLIAQTPSK